MQPDVVVCSGDLTTFGYKQEYAQARSYLDRLDCPRRHHHPRQPRLPERRLRPLRGDGGAALDRAAQARHHASSRSTRRSPTSTMAWSAAAATTGSRSSSSRTADFRVFVLHHHLLPIPGTGRERNVVHDAGDTLEVLQRAGVNLVLSGHKHVPYALAPGGPVRGQRRHGLLDARPRPHPPLLQRRRDRRPTWSTSTAATRTTGARRSSASRPRRWRTRSTRRSGGASDAPASAGAGRRRALPAGGARSPGAGVRGARRGRGAAAGRHREAGAAIPTTACRWSGSAGDAASSMLGAAARHGADRVLDLSDEPVLNEERRLWLAANALAAGLVYDGRRLRAAPAAGGRAGRALAWPWSEPASGSARRRWRRTPLVCCTSPGAGSWLSRWAAAARPSRN